MSKDLRRSEEWLAEHLAKRTRWQNGSETVDTTAATPPAPPPPRATAFEFNLPLPPSVNNLYGTNFATGAKFLVQAQKDFRHDVMQIVLATRKDRLPLAGRLEMQVILYQADTRRWDIDNRIKALWDAMAHAGAYGNDDQIDVLHAERIRRPGQPDGCHVVVREIA